MIDPGVTSHDFLSVDGQDELMMVHHPPMLDTRIQSVSRTIGPIKTPSEANSACLELFWSLGNHWIPYTQSQKAITSSTKSDVS